MQSDFKIPVSSFSARGIFLFLKQFDTRIVVNVCGHSLDEYLDVVKRLADEPIDMMEINISCPNVKEGGIAFGTDPKGVETITSEIKKICKAACYHEAFSKCHKHCRDSKGGRGRWS